MGIAQKEEILESLDATYDVQQQAPEPLPPLANINPADYGHHQQQVVDGKQEANDSNISSFISPNDFGGDYDFAVVINPHHGRKSPWVFSSALNKIFITINQSLPIVFQCTPPPAGSRFYVRATPIFAEQQYSAERVTRCISHAHVNEPTNQHCAPALWDHVVRVHGKHVVYEGSRAERRRLSVRVPYVAAAHGTDPVAVHYRFMCKNSCASEWGMNRRAIAVVFALEDEHRRTVGQRVVGVRVCSCPKRDKEKEEADFYKKDTSDQQQQHSYGKKRKLEKSSAELVDVDMRHFKIQIRLIGAANAKEMLRWAHARMASEMVLAKGACDQAYTKILNEIENKMNSPLEPCE